MQKIMNNAYNQVFGEIGKDWMLVAAEKDGKINAMTAGWGGLGVMWGRDVAFVVIRPGRYTREFVDAAETFSLSFFGGEQKDALGYFGKVSGRDEDKIAVAGMEIAREAGTPYFAEAEKALICKKLFAQQMDPACFLDDSIDARWYPQKDYHILYIGEITAALEK